MPRQARLVVPGLPHHVVQRGNRRQQTFFQTEDYRLYLSLMVEACFKHGNEIWAYCLMPNHSHLVIVPRLESSLRLAVGEAHRRYTRHINARQGWSGYLWQGRFASYAMDERHLLAAARYIELNPVRAKLVERPEDYPWSSTRAHLLGRDDGAVKVSPLLGLVGNWGSFLGYQPLSDEGGIFRKHERTGRPLGSPEFLQEIKKGTR